MRAPKRVTVTVPSEGYTITFTIVNLPVALEPSQHVYIYVCIYIYIYIFRVPVRGTLRAPFKVPLRARGVRHFAAGNLPIISVTGALKSSKMTISIVVFLDFRGLTLHKVGLSFRGIRSRAVQSGSSGWVHGGYGVGFCLRVWARV